jgi:hypothetical protein
MAEILGEGMGELIDWYYADVAGEWVLKNGSRTLKGKTISSFEV